MRTNAPWLYGVLCCWVLGSFVGGFALATGPRVIYSTIAASATSTVPEPNSVRKFHWIDRPWCSPDGNYFALTADGGADPNVDPNVDQFIIVGTTALDGNTVDARVVVREANLITGSIYNGPMHGRVCIRDDGQFMYTTNSDANQLNDEMIVIGDDPNSPAFSIAVRENDNVPDVAADPNDPNIHEKHGCLLDSPNYLPGDVVAYAAPKTRGYLERPADSFLIHDSLVLLQAGVDAPGGFEPNDPNYSWEFFDTDTFFVTPDGAYFLVTGDLVKDPDDPNEYPYDDVLAFDGAVVIQEGQPLPLGDPNYPDVLWVGGTVLSPAADWLAYGSYAYPEDPNYPRLDYVIRGGQMQAQTGDAVPCGLDGEHFLSDGASCTFHLLADNGVGGYVYGAATDAEDPNESEVLIWRQPNLIRARVILRTGMTVEIEPNAVPAGGALIDSFDDDAAFLTPGTPYDGGVLFVTAQLCDVERNPLGQALLRFRICVGDADADGDVDGDDLDLILYNEPSSGHDCFTNGDVDGDGDVDSDDHDIVLFNFGCGQST